MAAAVPSSEPTTINAGDTVTWTKSIPDYPATESWTLTYAFRLQNGSGLLDITASSSGTDFSATITATQSAQLAPGVWVFAGYVTKASERYLVVSGTVIVNPNLAKVDSQIDFRTPAKRAYDNALTAWEGVKLGQTVMLNGRTYTQHNLTELIKYVDRCKADYHYEVADQSGAPRRIGVRLSRV